MRSKLKLYRQSIIPHLWATIDCVERDVYVLKVETRPLGDISCIHKVRKLMANGTST